MFSARGSNGSVTHFLYDGDDLVAEYDASGALLRRYVHGPGSDEPLLWYEAGGLATRRILYADHQGSITAIMRSDGTLEATNSYDDYGIPAGLPTATAANPANLGRFQYTGQLWMSELGLYYYKARMYSPFAGRFMQTDPIGYDDGTNLYAYVGNDPVNLADSNGKKGESNTFRNFIRDLKATPGIIARDLAKLARDFRRKPLDTTVNVLACAPPILPGVRVAAGASRSFSPVGIPSAATSLSPGTSAQLRSFEVVKLFEVNTGTVAPAFGQPGGGIQLVTPVPLETLLRRGILIER